jgi:tetratricopeptide (TPR) repeat protein
LAGVYAAGQQWSEAERCAKQAPAKTYPRAALILAQAAAQREPTLANRIALADALLAAGEFTAGDSAWVAELKRDPDPPTAETLLAWGKQLNERGLHDLAELAAYQAMPQAATDARLVLAVALLGQQRLDEAEAEAKQIATQVRWSVLEAVEARRATWAARKDSEAVTKARAALAADPNKATLHNELGVKLNDDGRNDEAEASVRRAIDLFGAEHGTLRGNLCDMLRLQGRTTAAAIGYQQAIALDAQNRANWINGLGLCCYSLGLYQQADDTFRRAAAEAKTNRATYLANRADALNKLGRIGLAESLMREALALRPTARVHNELGNLLHTAERFDEAVEQYRQAIALNASSATYHANLAGSLLKLGRRDEALAAGRKAVELGYTRDRHWAIKELGL